MTHLFKQQWTVVQHYGFGYGDKEGFKQGLEERHVETVGMFNKIRKAGGLLFNTYKEASDYAFNEMYPKSVSGMYPNAPGKFTRFKLDELRVYLPKG